MMAPWQSFVVQYGRGVRAHLLAAVLAQPASEIQAFRRTVSTRPAKARTFTDLFQLWHGRAPVDADWPAPRRAGGAGYEWLGPELALLASMVGQRSTPEIARILTTRLRRLTGDPTAERDVNAVYMAQQRTGLQSADVLGGLTVAAASREVGCSSVLYNAIRKGELRAQKTGRYLVIARADLDAWKHQRGTVPPGMVRLASLKGPLGFKSDKLAEFAKAGRIPGAVQLNPFGTRERGTMFGTWYIPRALAAKLLRDRKAGKPMPWWGTADVSNLRVTYRLWQTRRHPARCASCRHIWGPAGAPTTFDDYIRRYPPLTHGAKRHLTIVYSDGLRLAEVAAAAHVGIETVQRAVRAGALRASRVGRALRVTRTDVSRWIARKCPTGGNVKSWVSLSTARAFYGFSTAELQRHIAAGRIRARIGTDGDQRGRQLVLRQQCRELRDELGYTPAQAAARLKIPVGRFLELAKGSGWRASTRVHRETINVVAKRLASRPGLTIAEAARALGVSRTWVEREIALGTARALQGKWSDRRYIPPPQMAHLRAAAAKGGTVRVVWTSEWMLLSDAALLAGVSPSMILRWTRQGAIKSRPKADTLRYHRRSVQARARLYWTHEVRFHRAQPPAWLAQERAA